MKKYLVKLDLKGESMKEIEELIKPLGGELLLISEHSARDYINKLQSLNLAFLNVCKGSFGGERFNMAFSYFTDSNGKEFVRLHFFRHSAAVLPYKGYATFDKALDNKLVELRPELRKDFGHFIVPKDEFDVNEFREEFHAEWFSGLIVDDRNVYTGNFYYEYMNEKGKDIFD